MFNPIEIPFGCKMLFNVVKLKDGVTIDDVELALGEMCNVVKNTYGNDDGGFIAGQVFKYAGFISDEGSVGEHEDTEDHVVIITFWQSFEQHEASHADEAFNDKFSALKELCTEAYELGYDMLWQGVPEDE
jgi:heme-degrading monooxygenase HmoA